MTIYFQNLLIVDSLGVISQSLNSQNFMSIPGIEFYVDSRNWRRQITIAFSEVRVNYVPITRGIMSKRSKKP